MFGADSGSGVVATIAKATSVSSLVESMIADRTCSRAIVPVLD